MPASPRAPVQPVSNGAAIIAVLSAHRPRPGDVIAFDADGTLWSGDVAYDLFAVALAEGLFREEARPGLVALLAAHDLEVKGSPTALVARTDAAFRAGAITEAAAYEMMAWGFAGYTEGELAALATDALRKAELPDRVRAAVPEVLAFAQEEGLRVLVVSASPVQVVRAGLDLCGLRVDAVVGAQAWIEGGRIAPSLAEPLPYGPQKVASAAAQVGSARWLASFGDSGFDFDLLAAAELAIAVGPKPALRRRLGELPGPVLLYEP